MLGKIFSLWNRFMIWKHRRYVLSQVNAGMSLGKNVTVCPGVKFDPPHSFLTSIGDNCIIAPDVRFLNHDASFFCLGKFAKIGKITIHENTFIGAGSLLLPGISIGPNAIIGAHSVVTKNIPSNSVVAGNPARILKSTSEIIEQYNLNIKEKKSPSFDSSSFYSKIHNGDFKKSVLSQLGENVAFTIGGDGDDNFLFNKV